MKNKIKLLLSLSLILVVWILSLMGYFFEAKRGKQYERVVCTVQSWEWIGKSFDTSVTVWIENKNVNQTMITRCRFPLNAVIQRSNCPFLITNYSFDCFWRQNHVSDVSPFQYGYSEPQTVAIIFLIISSLGGFLFVCIYLRSGQTTKKNKLLPLFSQEADSDYEASMSDTSTNWEESQSESSK